MTASEQADHFWLMFTIRERKKSREGAKEKEQNNWLNLWKK